MSLHGFMLNEAQGQIFLLNNLFVLAHGQLPSTAPKGTGFIRSTVCIHSGYVMARNFLLAASAYRPAVLGVLAWLQIIQCQAVWVQPVKIIPIFNHRPACSPFLQYMLVFLHTGFTIYI